MPIRSFQFTYRFTLRFAAPGRPLESAAVLQRLGEGVSAVKAKRGRVAFGFVRARRAAAWADPATVSTQDSTNAVIR